MKLRVAALALASLATATGCGNDSKDSDASNGIESKPPEQIVREASAALRDVKSYHVKSTDRDEGHAEGDVAVPKKLRVALTVGPAAADMIYIGSSMYIKANTAFWRDEADAGRDARDLAGRWFRAPAAIGGDLANEFDPTYLSRCLLKTHGSLARGGTAMVDGRPAVVVIDRGDRPGTAPGKLFVAATGPPLPLRTIATGKERPGGAEDPECDSENDTPTERGDEVIFSGYDEPVDIQEPPAAVDLSGGTAS